MKLDEGISLALLCSFARDMFPSISLEDIADDGQLVISVRMWVAFWRRLSAAYILRPTGGMAVGPEAAIEGVVTSALAA